MVPEMRLAVENELTAMLAGKTVRNVSVDTDIEGNYTDENRVNLHFIDGTVHSFIIADDWEGLLMDTIIELDGLALSHLRDILDRNGIWSLRIATDAGCVKFKVNEDMWTAPIPGALVQQALEAI